MRDDHFMDIKDVKKVVLENNNPGSKPLAKIRRVDELKTSGNFSVPVESSNNEKLGLLANWIRPVTVGVIIGLILLVVGYFIKL